MALQSAFGLVVLGALAWLLSERRGAFTLGHTVKRAGIGIALQLALAALLLKLPPAQNVFLWLNGLVAALQEATTAGTSFVFGYLGGGPLPFEETQPGASFVLAFRALPLILVISALSSLLFYWRILPAIVRAFAWALQRSLRIGGAVGVSAAANVFVGMVEAPLLIRPYLGKLTRSELFMVMTCGMATIAGTVMVIYATILDGVIANPIGHILVASIVSVPAAITVAQLMVPESGQPTPGTLDAGARPVGAMDAITRGAIDGIGLLLNVTAMLVVLVALVHLANLGLGLLPAMGNEALTLQGLLGYVMAPLAWLMGIPWSEALTAGSLLGTKIVLNEFIAYLDFAALPGDALTPRSRLIMTYALCGFANFGSLGIMIGGLGAIAPGRRGEIVALGLKSIVAGTIATSMTGAVVGIF